jgi:hypothetical protein
MNWSLSPKRVLTGTRVFRPRGRSHTRSQAHATPLDEGLRFFRGVWIAIPIAIALWIVIAVAVFVAFSSF